MINMEEIKTLVHRYQDAIHTQNKEDFYSLWTDNAKCELISIATVFITKESIYQDFLINGIQKAYSEITLVAENIDINEVNDHLAIVVFKYHTECIRRETNEPYGIQGVETQVVVKEDNEWKLLHIHYSKA